jgi:hypothetical protein
MRQRDCRLLVPSYVQLRPVDRDNVVLQAKLLSVLVFVLHSVCGLRRLTGLIAFFFCE